MSFSDFNWFDQVQHKIILAALKCQSMRGVNVWGELVEELYGKA